MKKKRFFKLALFLAVVGICFALDAGLGIVGSTMFLAMAGIGAVESEPEGTLPAVEKPIDTEAITNALNNQLDAKLRETNGQIVVLKNSIDSLEALVRQGGSQAPAKFDNEFRNMTRKSLLGIINGKPEMIHNSFLNEGTDSAGAYTVPSEMYSQILDNVYAKSSIMRNAQIYNMTGKSLKLNKVDTAPTFAFDSAEGAERSVSNPVFGQAVLERHDGGFIVIFSKQLLEDSGFDITSYITGLAAKILGNAIENIGYNGNTSPAIKGLHTAANGFTDFEIDGTAFTNLIYDDLINAIACVPAEELNGSKWFMHPKVWSFIKTLKIDSKTYAVSPEDRKLNLLEGYPVELSTYAKQMTDSAVSTKMLTFGNLLNMALGIRKMLEFTFSKDATVTTGGTDYNLWQRGLVGLNFGTAFDIDYTFPTSIVNLTTKAS
jgi:HK97 family phage major capsid protein